MKICCTDLLYWNYNKTEILQLQEVFCLESPTSLWNIGSLILTEFKYYPCYIFMFHITANVWVKAQKQITFILKFRVISNPNCLMEAPQAIQTVSQNELHWEGL